MQSSSLRILAVLLACLLKPCSTASFLGSTEASDFLVELAHTELETAHVAQAAYIARLEKLMRPMYTALPKTAQGNLGHASTRYALHRFFAQHYAWFIKNMAKGEWNIPSLGNILGTWVPQYVLDAFELRLAREGLNLHELAILAAAVQRVAQHQLAGKLLDVYRIRQLDPQKPLSPEQMVETLLTYMMSYMYGVTNLSDMTLEDINEILYKDGDPLWDHVKIWTHDLYTTDEVTQEDRKNPFVSDSVDFDEAVRLVFVFTKRFGYWSSEECRELKSEILEVEHGGTGRARLSDYYAAELNGSVSEPFNFDETPDSLRALGVLDETNPENPSIIIPNFLNARANCHTSTPFYDTCCVDECEALMSHIERDAASPVATPEQIAKLVEALPSDTIDAPRNLSPVLLQRLEEISTLHVGHVPLHGRMFAQWMHHAYPRECPFPHSGSSKEMMDIPENFMWKHNGEGLVSEADMRKIARTAIDASANGSATIGAAGNEADVREIIFEGARGNLSRGKSHDAVAVLPWNVAEELLSDTPLDHKPVSAARLERFGRDLGKCLLLASGLGSLVYSMRRFSFDGKHVADPKEHLV